MRTGIALLGLLLAGLPVSSAQQGNPHASERGTAARSKPFLASVNGAVYHLAGRG